MIINEHSVSTSPIDTVSPTGSSTVSDTPTPPNGMHDKNWVTTYQNIGICEEHHQLLGTEEESSDKHSSDGETDICDVWTITEEQHQYYNKQFKLLQPDVTGLINGYDARAYFEKSMLSIEDLRKIWQLSDVTKDGALSLAEFKIAMHLVVLKRNFFQLPDVLPKSLVCSVLPTNKAAIVTLPSPSLSKSESLSSAHIEGKEVWTKFTDSPTSLVISPGPKPVNFDFQRPTVEQNPKIFHPVAVRATPVPEHVIDVKNDVGMSSITESAVPADTVPIKPIQRPQLKRPSAPGPLPIPPSLYASVEDMMNLPVITTNKKEQPPPPPPRPTRTHFRSSSLDLNKLGKLVNCVQTLPPRNSPSVDSLAKFDSHLINSSHFADFSPSYHGAFHVYKRTDVKTVSEKQTQKIKKEAVPEICLEEKNHYLMNVCQELQDELNSLREERITLQFKLDKLHLRSHALEHFAL